MFSWARRHEFASVAEPRMLSASGACGATATARRASKRYASSARSPTSSTVPGRPGASMRGGRSPQAWRRPRPSVQTGGSRSRWEPIGPQQTAPGSCAWPARSAASGCRPPRLSASALSSTPTTSPSSFTGCPTIPLTLPAEHRHRASPPVLRRSRVSRESCVRRPSSNATSGSTGRASGPVSTRPKARSMSALPSTSCSPPRSTPAYPSARRDARSRRALAPQ